MTLSYNVTGPERKKLVGAISQILDAPAEYQGAPSFAYTVGDYHIDKTGTVTGPNVRAISAEIARLTSFAAHITGELGSPVGPLQPPAGIESEMESPSESSNVNNLSLRQNNQNRLPKIKQNAN